jgi:hypothetical protein
MAIWRRFYRLLFRTNSSCQLWTLVGAADFDRDGKPDYYYNVNTQQTWLNYLGPNPFAWLERLSALVEEVHP